jgi:hypothetical protein
MKIEEIIKSNITLKDAKKVILNILYTQNVINDKFNEILKPNDLSSEQYNVLRILRGQKGSPANMCVIQERMLAKNSNTTRLIDKLLLKKYVTREVCPNNRRKIEEHEHFFAANLEAEELEKLNYLLEKYRNIK